MTGIIRTPLYMQDRCHMLGINEAFIQEVRDIGNGCVCCGDCIALSVVWNSFNQQQAAFSKAT